MIDGASKWCLNPIIDNYSNPVQSSVKCAYCLL